MRRWIEAWFPSQHHWPLTEGPLSKFDQPNLWCHLILIWLFFWLMPNKWILYIQLQIVNRIQNLREKVAQPTDTRGGGLLWIFFGWRQVDLATSFEFTSNIINFVILFPPVTFSSKFFVWWFVLDIHLCYGLKFNSLRLELTLSVWIIPDQSMHMANRFLV
jgi:hypothetical protein